MIILNLEKVYFYLFSIILSFSVSAQDTINFQTLTWDSNGRSYWYNFPEIPADQIERINMIYNMRCHNAAVGNGNVGCYEWDYSCNTFITDTNRVDSILALHKKYIIPGTSNNEYYYSLSPTSNCISVKQKEISYTSINNEKIVLVGKADESMILGPGAGKLLLLYTKDELKSTQLSAGKISGLELKLLGEGAEVLFFKVRMKALNETQLEGKDVNPLGYTETYFSNTTFGSNQSKRIIFHTPFNWDGSSSILVELSYNAVKDNKTITIESQKTSSLSLGFQNDAICLSQYGSSGYSLDVAKMNSISDEITIALWTKGDTNALPANTSIFEAVDVDNKRQINAHLPWSNGSVYWDCGNDGNGYDRIEKPANVKEFEGQWTHWAFTKNAKTGNMRIFKNGSLWHSGNGKTRKIQVDRMNFLSNIDHTLSYFGKLSQFSIWNKELDSLSIRNWMYSAGDKNHPDYTALKYFFPLNDNVQGILSDQSDLPRSINTNSFLNWIAESGRNGIGGFQKIFSRPLTGFIQGTVNGLSSTDKDVIEEISNPSLAVDEFHIQNGTAKINKTHQVYPAGDFFIFNENGEFVDIKIIPHDGIFVNEDLKYQRYAASKFELLSLVTPYGNGLDLGKEGKTFVFDVTDFAPILRGNKKLSIEMGGENQEELDIKFQYIRGKSSRVIKDIQNVYMFQRQWFPDILSNTVLEPRKIRLNSESKFYKLRTTITGHEQNGEFVSRSHFIKVNGNRAEKKFDFNVWKECASNPIYPQGGTWIFDRAGWCPGAASDTYFHDISDLADANSDVTIDYGLNGANLTQANYLISCQLVSYGDYQFNLDAGIENVIRPNSKRVEYERFNPSCSRPEIQIRNYGKQEINSLTFQYGMINGDNIEYNWKGSLLPSAIANVELPLSDIQLWKNAQSNGNIFVVEIIKINDRDDENNRNNRYTTEFNLVRNFDFDPVFEIRTNTVAGDNSFRIKDLNGNILIEKKNINANTTIQENLIFPNGCYRIEVDDRANDGLSFWFYPNFGSGSSAIKKRQNTTLIPIQTFRSDFGAGYQYDFIINKPNSVHNLEDAYSLRVYPIPADLELFIEFESQTFKPTSIKLIHVSGKSVYERKFDDYQQIQKLTIPISELQTGLYFLEISNTRTKLSKKVFVE
ncbi:MAG: T9SS type A sorting domain-containing protein [Saprospiraceae bacterium]|nr:T9SS type A sorting domain-containing protein [Saprospiraceae bacterium]